MEITLQQKKALVVIVIIIVVLVALLFLARFFSAYLSTRVVPEISESIVGGKLLGSKVTAGQHTLQFKAKTSDGQIITDSVTFTTETDPYGDPGGDDGNDPYSS